MNDRIPPPMTQHLVGADAYIGPAECSVFTGISGEFVTSKRADRVVGPYNNVAFSVGADDSVRPQDAPPFMMIFGEFATLRRADVGIGLYNRVGMCIQVSSILYIQPAKNRRIRLDAPVVNRK